ncbi:transcriptional regulator [Verticiella sediminum]|uniref:Transcriptional regulator n=1 Tax=Verticiella sediminum TaxID=1247510 RepID=A0A556AXA9_9BURK|nr:metalloregulator ArsR/SmtB family transcription factor [Verticiella sediminum]TSH97055.1 transcriptional regulator [Verticiella sediminum]
MSLTPDSLRSSGAAATPADRILEHLKLHGPQSAAQLGEALSISGEAARQQLVRLGGMSLVQARSRANGVGRPTRVWRLTPSGHARFPDAHGVLAGQLLESARQLFGEAGVERLISARESEARTAYQQALQGCPDLASRVAALAGIRSAEGYMCSWRALDEHTFLLIENHCPICTAARACQGFCRSELALFEAVLGPGVRVRRLEHLQSGGERCTYRISASARPPEGG